MVCSTTSVDGINKGYELSLKVGEYELPILELLLIVRLLPYTLFVVVSEYIIILKVAFELLGKFTILYEKLVDGGNNSVNVFPKFKSMTT